MKTKRYVFDELSADEKYHVQLKLATRKNDVDRHCVMVKINLGTAKEVIISKRDRAKCIFICSKMREPVCNKLRMYLISHTEKI